MPLTTLVAGNTARASHVNGNFALCVLTDTARTISVSHTWSASQTFSAGWTAAAAVTVTAASATAFAVGRQGATDPVLLVHSSTASQTTGVKVTGAAEGGGVAVAAISSGTNEALTIDAKGSGTITLGGTSTGAITLTRATTLSAALTYGGVTLSNAVTGTGNMVLSASPTFTGTTVINAATVSGTITLNGTVAGTPTWSSNQAITLSTAAQPNVTSLGTLTSLTTSGTTQLHTFVSFGGTSSSFVALKRSTTTLQVRLADDSNDGNFQAANISMGSTNSFIIGSRGSLKASADGAFNFRNDADSAYGGLTIAALTATAGTFSTSAKTTSGSTAVNTGAGAVTLFTVPGPGAYVINCYTTDSEDYVGGVAHGTRTNTLIVTGMQNGGAGIAVGSSAYAFTITNTSGTNRTFNWSYFRVLA